MTAVSRALIALVCVATLWGTAFANPASLLRGLDTDDPAALASGVAAIESAPATPDLADVLFAAGRACEDRLHDPARALAIYERILREMPDAGVSIAAERRAARLRGARLHAREAAELAHLLANADSLPVTDVERRAQALTTIAWPGALDAALFYADWLCRTDRHLEANARYAEIVRTAGGAPQVSVARRNAAGCAIEAGDWQRAEELARALPTGDPVDAAVRDDLLSAAERGRTRDRLYTAAWVALVLTILALLASLGEAVLRGGARRPSWQPPIEVLYLGPIALIVIAAAFATDRLIVESVVWITITGIGMAWVSGAALDLLRLRGRDVRVRSVVHAFACAVGVLSVGFIAIMSGGLIDMFSETVRFGPGG